MSRREPGPQLCSACSASWPDRPAPHFCSEEIDAIDVRAAERSSLAGALVERAGKVRHGHVALLNAASDIELGRL